MPRASIYVLACLVSGVSAALILASGSSYAEARFPQGTAHHFKGGHSTCHGGADGCWTTPYQIANLNSVEDFCLWAPSPSATEDTQHALVAWCLKGAHSTRLIPDGAILGARLLTTPEYVQITGVGNLSRINVPSWGTVSASGDRSHSLVFTTAYGQLEQIYDWTSFVSQDRFCFRACRPSATASATCPPVRDVLGCADDTLGSYDVGTFQDCVGDGMKAPFTLFQGVLASSHDTSHPFSSCTIRRIVGDARVTHARRAIACTSNCTDTSSTSSLVPTTTHNATTTLPSLPLSTSSSTTYTNSSTPTSSAPPVSPSNDTCTLYSRPPPHPHPHPSYASPSPVSSLNISFSSSGCLSGSPSDLPSMSSGLSSSSTLATPPFTPTVPAYSSSDPLSFGTLPSTTSSDSLPVVTSPTSLPTFTSTYDSFSPPSDSSPSSLLSSSSSDYIASSMSPSSLPESEFSTLSSSQSPGVPILTSSSFTSDPLPTSESSQSPTVSIPSSSSVTTLLPIPSPTFPNSQTQLGSQCPPPSLAARNGAGRSVGSFLLSLMLPVLTIVSFSALGVLIL